MTPLMTSRTIRATGIVTQTSAKSRQLVRPCWAPAVLIDIVPDQNSAVTP